MLMNRIDEDIKRALFPEQFTQADTPEQEPVNETPAATTESKNEEVKSLYGREFTPVGYEQIVAMITRIKAQGIKNSPYIIDNHTFKLTAFSKAKRARNWDFPQGARGFEIVDLQDIFLENHEYGEFFDCYFLTTPQGNPYRAWLYKNTAGVVRYYSVSPYDKDERYAFDAIDLYGAVFGKEKVVNHDTERYLRHQSYEMVRNEQTILSNHRVLDEKDRLQQVQDKLSQRQRKVDTEYTDETMSAVFYELVEEAKHRTFNESQYDHEGRTIFFMSTGEMAQRIAARYANEELVKKSKATLNNAINLLSALGFITKLSDKELDEYSKDIDLSYERNKLATNGKNPISYYVINDIPSVYWVKKQAKKLLNKNINIHNVTERGFKRALGPEDAKKIFLVDFATKKNELHQAERKEYIRTFLLRIKEQGFVTKAELEGIIPSKNVSDKVWTRLASETRGVYFKRSTKQLREDLGIDATGAVMVSTLLVHPNVPRIRKHLTIEEELELELMHQYEELTAQVLLWYEDIFDKDYSRDEEQAEFQANLNVMHSTPSVNDYDEMEVANMNKNEVDNRGDFRFMGEDLPEIEESLEFEQPKAPRRRKKNVENYDKKDGQPRTPETDEEIELARKADEFLKRWGV